VGVLARPLDDSALLAFNQATNPHDFAPPPFWPSNLWQIRSENRQQPKCLSCPMPPFAIDGRPAGPTGAVVVRALITTDGRPVEIEVLVPLSPERDAQAIQAVKNWKFEPGRKTLGGTIVASEIATWIRFEAD
jgi:TonB family protein